MKPFEGFLSTFWEALFLIVVHQSRVHEVVVSERSQVYRWLHCEGFNFKKGLTSAVCKRFDKPLEKKEEVLYHTAKAIYATIYYTIDYVMRCGNLINLRWKWYIGLHIVCWLCSDSLGQDNILRKKKKIQFVVREIRGKQCNHSQEGAVTAQAKQSSKIQGWSQFDSPQLDSFHTVCSALS